MFIMNWNSMTFLFFFCISFVIVYFPFSVYLFVFFNWPFCVFYFNSCVFILILQEIIDWISLTLFTSCLPLFESTWMLTVLLFSCLLPIYFSFFGFLIYIHLFSNTYRIGIVPHRQTRMLMKLPVKLFLYFYFLPRCIVYAVSAVWEFKTRYSTSRCALNWWIVWMYNMEWKSCVKFSQAPFLDHVSIHCFLFNVERDNCHAYRLTSDFRFDREFKVGWCFVHFHGDQSDF